MTKDEANHKLFEAAQTGNVRDAYAALDAGADAKSKDKFERSTPLHSAVYKGHIDVARLLIERGADVNAENAWNRTPLHWASFANHVDAAQLLIDHGAQVDAKDKSQITPLQLATDKGNTAMVSLLEQSSGRTQSHAVRVLEGRGDNKAAIG